MTSKPTPKVCSPPVLGFAYATPPQTPSLGQDTPVVSLGSALSIFLSFFTGDEGSDDPPRALPHTHALSALSLWSHFTRNDPPTDFTTWQRCPMPLAKASTPPSLCGHPAQRSCETDRCLAPRSASKLIHEPTKVTTTSGTSKHTSKAPLRLENTWTTSFCVRRASALGRSVACHVPSSSSTIPNQLAPGVMMKQQRKS